MPPKKRKASGKQAKTESKQSKQDGQKAVSHELDIPLDEGFKEDGKNSTFSLKLSSEGVFYRSSKSFPCFLFARQEVFPLILSYSIHCMFGYFGR